MNSVPKYERWKGEYQKREQTQRATNKHNLEVPDVAWQIPVKWRGSQQIDLQTLIIYKKQSIKMYACHAHYIKIGSIEYEIFMSKAKH